MPGMNQVGYGLDIQGESPVLVRAAKRGGRWAYDTCRIDDERSRQELAAGEAIAVGMPPQQCLTPRLEAPYRSRRKAAKVFPTLLDIQLPFALEDCVYEILADADPVGSGSSALAIVARKTDVRDAIDRVKSVGVDPTRVDHEGVAIWAHSMRELQPAPGDTTLPHVIVYLGLDRTTIAVGIGQKYIAAHGMNHLDTAHLRRLLRSSLGTDARRVHWVWAGPGAIDEAAVVAIQKELEATWPGESTTHDDPSTFLARALAARSIASPVFPCNLRTGELAHPATEMRDAGLLQKAALLILGAGIVMCASGFIGRTMIERRVAAADQQFVDEVENILGYSPGAARGEYALRMVREHVVSQAGALAPLLDMFSASLTGLINGVVAFGVEEGVRIEAIIVRGNQFECRGALREWDTGEQLGSVLESRGYYWDLVRGDALRDGSIPFSIKGRARK